MKNEYTLFENEPATEMELKDAESSLLAARNQQMDNMMENKNVSAISRPMESDIPEMDENAQTYEKKEIFADVTAYFHGDELAASVWIDKYALKNKEGKLVERTPDDMPASATATRWSPFPTASSSATATTPTPTAASCRWTRSRCS